MLKLEEDSGKYWVVNDFISSSSGEYKNHLARQLLVDFEREPNFPDELILSNSFIISTSKNTTDSVLQNHDERILGFLNMSSFVYNQDSSKSCIYINLNLGEHGGGIYLVFLEKKEIGILMKSSYWL